MLTDLIFSPHGARNFNRKIVKNMHYAIATFLLDKHSRSENTLKLYERVLTDFANFVPDYTRDIGPENIEAYLLQLQLSQDVLRIVGKGRRNRSVPLNDTVKEIMIRNPNLEMIRHRNRIWVFRLCHEASRLLGLIPPFSPHSCRHYFSNELYHRGVPVATISKLLGHADSSITENVYLNWSEESLNGVTDILD